MKNFKKAIAKFLYICYYADNKRINAKHRNVTNAFVVGRACAYARG